MLASDVPQKVLRCDALRAKRQHYANQGKERAIQLLRTARQWLQDELAATDADAGPVAGLNTTAHTGLHPQIRSKCEALYASSAFAEAVEKSFKVVRDRLRELTGYEKDRRHLGREDST